MLSSRGGAAGSAESLAAFSGAPPWATAPAGRTSTADTMARSNQAYFVLMVPSSPKCDVTDGGYQYGPAPMAPADTYQRLRRRPAALTSLATRPAGARNESVTSAWPR